MARHYYYRVLKYTPSIGRGEVINVGIVVVKRGALDIHMLKTGAKIDALTGKRGGLTRLKFIKRTIAFLYEPGMPTKDFIQLIKAMGTPVTVSEEGFFVANNEKEYRERVKFVMRELVEPRAG